MFPWHLFPLLMQGLAVLAAVPALLKLVQHKRSDQRALADHWLSLVAQASMVAWAYAWAQQPGIVASSTVALITTLASAAVIVYYRVHPGGRPRGARTLGGEFHRVSSRLDHLAYASVLPRVPPM